MSNNPSEPADQSENDPAPTENVSDVRAAYNLVSDTVVGVNVRWSDNKFQAVTGTDTASSVRRIVAEGDKKTAAIGSRRACEMYGGKILRENIADDAENITYFYLVGRH